MAVTVGDVKEIYTPPATMTDDDLTVHLETAQLVVTEQLSNCGMSTARLDKITIYLTAHFAEISAVAAEGYPGAIRRDKLGEADQSYAVPTGDDMLVGYKSTRWGQMAIALDTCNILISSSALKAEFRVV